MPNKTYKTLREQGQLEGLDVRQRKKLYGKHARRALEPSDDGSEQHSNSSTSSSLSSVPSSSFGPSSSIEARMYYRIGTIPTSEADGSGKLDDKRQSDNEEEDETDIDGNAGPPIQKETVIVGYFHRTKNHDRLQLIKVEAWRINGLLIGDCENGEVVSRIPRSITLHDRLQGATTKSEVQQLLTELIEQGEAQVVTQDVPFLPGPSHIATCSFPFAQSLASEDLMNLVVRIVDTSESLPPQMKELGVIAAGVDYDELMEAVESAQGFALDQGRTELFVLPQIEGFTQMQRWSGGSLHLFSRRSAERRELYVEARLLPMTDEEMMAVGDGQ